MRSCAVLVLALAGAALSPSAVRAHALETSLERLTSLNDGLMLESRFSSGEPVPEAQVRLIPPNGGEPILVGRTDLQGQLRFQLPAGVSASEPWEVQVDGGPGHRDYVELSEDGQRTAVPADPAQNLQADLRQHLRETPLPVVSLGLLSLGGLVSLRGVLAWKGRPAGGERGPRS
ncbi:MAG: hypothetical protein VKJ66_10665 [Synechococcus sp.]|nr:hypothetical protein [Synechococcus sp.]